MSEEEELSLKAHARSILQHRYESFTEEGYFKPLGTLAALLDICDLSDIVALGDSFGLCAEGRVAPDDSELTCSTQQCCTEYL